jgi:hypothetical protein
MLTVRTLAASAMLVMTAATTPSYAAETQTGTTVVGPSNLPVNLSLREFAELPTTQVQTNFLTEDGRHAATFDGPLLWTVLQKAGVINPASTGSKCLRRLC